jgi:hypothetical protein
VWRISINKETNTITLILLFFKRVENSSTRGERVSLIIIWNMDFRVQNEGKRRRKINESLVQFKGRGSEEAGSKIENRLFIIFSLVLKLLLIQDFLREKVCW